MTTEQQRKTKPKNIRKFLLRLGAILLVVAAFTGGYLILSDQEISPYSHEELKEERTQLQHEIDEYVYEIDNRLEWYQKNDPELNLSASEVNVERLKQVRKDLVAEKDQLDEHAMNVDQARKRISILIEEFNQQTDSMELGLANRFE